MSSARAGASPARAPRGTVTRARVVDTASRLIAAEGYENVTMRGLARELGVAPMSLYRHVANKDDLLDEVVDRLLLRRWRPRSRDANWRKWMTEAADNLRSLLVEQPAALHVFLSHPVVSPAALDRMEAMMAVLRRVLGSEVEVTDAWAAIQTYTIGFAALEASREQRSAVGAPGSEVAEQLAGFATPHQFAVGLRFLLDGIETPATADLPDQGGPSASVGQQAAASR